MGMGGDGVIMLTLTHNDITLPYCSQTAMPNFPGVTAPITPWHSASKHLHLEHVRSMCQLSGHRLHKKQQLYYSNENKRNLLLPPMTLEIHILYYINAYVHTCILAYVHCIVLWKPSSLAQMVWYCCLYDERLLFSFVICNKGSPNKPLSSWF